MKKVVFVILFLLCAFYAVGGPVSEQTARQIAESFAKSESPTRSVYGSPILAMRGIYSAAPKVYDAPSYYVYNMQEGGFVIVAGDDIARPILAYSKTGQIDMDRISDCMLDWLDQYAQVIYDLSIQGVSPSINTQNEWASLLSGEAPHRGADVVLETASWSQWGPYNMLCPIIDGQQCPTGCVNTACAIAMKYYSHPQKGTGTVGGYYYEIDHKLYYVDAYPLGHSYNWEEMPNKYAYGYTDDQAYQVAQLMKDLGYANRTHYSPKESGASTEYLASNLTSLFDFDLSLTCYNHAYITEESWNNVLHNEIDSGRPIIFIGGDSQFVYHAFIVCGYSGDYYCFNMGWGGGSDTFALMSPIDGYEEYLVKYYRGQTAYTNIKPNEGGEKPALDYLLVRSLGDTNWSYQNEGYFFIKGFDADYHAVVNSVGMLDLAYGLVDRDYNLKEILSVKTGYVIREEGYGQFSLDQTCRAPSSYSPDDYFALCVRKPGESEWRVPEHLPGAMIPLKYNGIIEDAVRIVVSKKTSTGKKVVRFIMPKGIAIEMKRDDGFMDGFRYAYECRDLPGYDKTQWIPVRDCIYEYFNGHQINTVNTNREHSNWEVTFFDSEKRYTINLSL